MSKRPFSLWPKLKKNSPSRKVFLGHCLEQRIMISLKFNKELPLSESTEFSVCKLVHREIRAMHRTMNINLKQIFTTFIVYYVLLFYFIFKLLTLTLKRLLCSGSNKLEEAIECYQRAGNMFKMSKNWSKAGECFCEAANLHARAGSRHDAGTCYVDASNCYKKSDIEGAVSCLLKAIDIYTDMGRFSMAAKHHQSIAEMYESDPNTLVKSIQHYEQAADYFKGEESLSSANKCMLKVAQYAAQLEDYEKAISIYEQVAASSLESSLLKYSAKEYFFRAALCHLSVDLLNAQHAIEKYSQQYPAFQDSREYKLIKVLCEHLEEQNIEGFTEAVKDYDSISRLDQWYTTILLRIKKAADEDPDLR